MPYPSDPQSFNRYAYARNNPIRYIDPSGHSWASFFTALVGGLAAGAVFALTAGAAAPFIVSCIAAGIVGGAVSGGISGGWQGALTGAGVGALMGAGAGLWGATFIGASVLAGGAYAYATGGWEGLGDFGSSLTGGMVGGAIGYGIGAGIGNAFASEPLLGGDLEPLDSRYMGLGDGETVIDAQYALDIDMSMSVSPESPDDVGIVEIYSRDVHKPWIGRLKDAHPYAKATWEAEEYHELGTKAVGNKTLINILEGNAGKMTEATQAKINTSPQPLYRGAVSKAKFYRAIDSYISKYDKTNYSARTHIRNCRGFMDYIMNDSVIR